MTGVGYSPPRKRTRDAPPPSPLPLSSAVNARVRQGHRALTVGFESAYHHNFVPILRRVTMSTRFATKDQAVASDDWFVIDAENQVLGRLATRVATLLAGKHKTHYAPFMVTGDHVVVINAEKVRLTGAKMDQKVYYRHTGYPGGLREVPVRRMLQIRPERVIEEAVLGMLPKNKLRKKLAGRLRVYRGTEHPHEAQKPQPLEV